MGRFKNKLRDADRSAVADWAPIGQVVNRGLLPQQNTVTYDITSPSNSTCVPEEFMFSYNRVKYPLLSVNDWDGFAGEADFQMQVDSSGNKYVMWYYYDGVNYIPFMSKVSSNGTVLYEKYIETNGVKNSNTYQSIDSSGNLYVSNKRSGGGVVSSTLTKISPAGAVLWTIQFASSTVSGNRYPYIDPSGNVILVEFISSYMNIIKVSPTGTILASTRTLLGTLYSFNTFKLQFDSAGNIYIYGLPTPNIAFATGSAILKFSSALSHLATFSYQVGPTWVDRRIPEMYIFNDYMYVHDWSGRVTKFDLSGNKIWETCYQPSNDGDPNNFYDAWLDGGIMYFDRSEGAMYVIENRNYDGDDLSLIDSFDNALYDNKTGLCVMKIDLNGNLLWSNMIAFQFPSPSVIEFSGTLDNIYGPPISGFNTESIGRGPTLDILTVGYYYGDDLDYMDYKFVIMTIAKDGSTVGSAKARYDVPDAVSPEVEFIIYENVSDIKNNTTELAQSSRLQDLSLVYTTSALTVTLETLTEVVTMTDCAFPVSLHTTDTWGPCNSDSGEASLFAQKLFYNNDFTSLLFDIAADADGNRFMLGWTASAPCVIKLNKDDQQEKVVMFQTSPGTVVNVRAAGGAQILFKDGYVYAKVTKDEPGIGGENITCITKFDTNLNVIQTDNIYHPLSADTTYAGGMAVDDSGNKYFIHGIGPGTPIRYTYAYVTKVSAAGAVVWTKKIDKANTTAYSNHSTNGRYGFDIDWDSGFLWIRQWYGAAVAKFDTNLALIKSYVLQRQNTTTGVWEHTNFGMRDSAVKNGILATGPANYTDVGSAAYDIATGVNLYTSDISIPSSDVDYDDPRFVDGMYAYAGAVTLDNEGSTYCAWAWYYDGHDAGGYDDRGFSGMVVTKTLIDGTLAWAKQVEFWLDPALTSLPDYWGFDSFMEVWRNSICINEGKGMLEIALDGEIYGEPSSTEPYYDYIPGREDYSWHISLPLDTGGNNGEANIPWDWTTEFVGMLYNPYNSNTKMILSDADISGGGGYGIAPQRLYDDPQPVYVVTTVTAATTTAAIYTIVSNPPYTDRWELDYFNNYNTFYRGWEETRGDDEAIYYSGQIRFTTYPNNLLVKDDGSMIGILAYTDGSGLGVYPPTRPSGVELIEFDSKMNIKKRKYLQWNYSSYWIISMRNAYIEGDYIYIQTSGGLYTGGPSSFTGNFRSFGMLKLDMNFNIVAQKFYQNTLQTPLPIVSNHPTELAYQVSYYGGAPNYLPYGYIYRLNKSDGTLVTSRSWSCSDVPTSAVGIWQNVRFLGRDSSGNFYMMGYAKNATTSSRQSTLIKLDASASLVWAKNILDAGDTYTGMFNAYYSSTIGPDDHLYLVSFDYGQYYPTGTRWPYDTGSDIQGFTITKFDTDGVIVWTKWLAVPPEERYYDPYYLYWYPDEYPSYDGYIYDGDFVFSDDGTEMLFVSTRNPDHYGLEEPNNYYYPILPDGGYDSLVAWIDPSDASVLASKMIRWKGLTPRENERYNIQDYSYCYPTGIKNGRAGMTTQIYHDDDYLNGHTIDPENNYMEHVGYLTMNRDDSVSGVTNSIDYRDFEGDTIQFSQMFTEYDQLSMSASVSVGSARTVTLASSSLTNPTDISGTHYWAPATNPYKSIDQHSVNSWTLRW